MSFSLYDKAVVEKIKEWVTDAKTVVLAPDETDRLFKWNADETNDSPITLPMITIQRDRDVTIRSVVKTQRTYEGKAVYNENGITGRLCSVPVSIGYTINIYTRTLEEADGYVNDFVFNIINYPNLEITLETSDGPLQQMKFITLQPDITDGSDIPQRLMPDQFKRMVLSFRIDDAELYWYTHRAVPVVAGTETKAIIPPTRPKGKRSATEEAFMIPLKDKED